MKEIEVEDSTIENINSPEYVLKHGNIYVYFLNDKNISSILKLFLNICK